MLVALSSASGDYMYGVWQFLAVLHEYYFCHPTGHFSVVTCIVLTQELVWGSGNRVTCAIMKLDWVLLCSMWSSTEGCSSTVEGIIWAGIIYC